MTAVWAGFSTHYSCTGQVVSTANEATEAARELGEVVIKSQVLTGKEAKRVALLASV